MNTQKLVSKAKKSFVQQLEETDCGIAALRSVLRYHGADATRQELRYWSGSTATGTNMFGLSQAAQKAGLEAEGYIATVEQLPEAQFPCILHAISPQQLGHYLVAYGQVKGKWLIGDPAKGLQRLSNQELANCWKSGALLCLAPSPKLKAMPQPMTLGFWQQIKQWVQPDWPALVAILGLGVLTALLGLTTSLCTQKLVDDWLPSQNSQTLLLGIFLLAWLLLLRVGFNFFRGKLLLKYSWHLDERLMGHFFQGMLQMPLVFHQMRTKADWMQRMRDSQRIKQLVNVMVGQVGVDILSLLAGIALLSYYHWSIGLLGIALAPLYFLLTHWQQKRIMQEQRMVMSKQSMQETFHLEALQQMETIQSGAATNTFAARSRQQYHQWLESVWSLGTSKLQTNTGLELLGMFALIALLGLCAYGILAQQWALGLLIGSITAWNIASGASHRLGMLTFQIQESKIALERLSEAGSKEKSNRNKVCAVGEWRGIVAHQLDLQLQGQASPMLHIPHFSAMKGEIVAIIGPSGTGKTSLMQVLQGHRTMEKGLVTSVWKNTVDDTRFDIPIKELSMDFWRSKTAYMPQKPQIFTGTVVENICLFQPEQDWKKVVAFCQHIGLHSFIEQLPQGYFSMIGEGGIPLSEGQKQLLALARALFQRPQLLFLDEPTASLDEQTAQLVRQLLQRVKKSMGIVLISHRATDRAIADRVYHIEDKKLCQVNDRTKVERQ